MTTKMTKEQKIVIPTLILVGVGIALCIAFTVDDITGIGLLLNPVQFAVMALYGLGSGAFLSKRKKAPKTR